MKRYIYLLTTIFVLTLAPFSFADETVAPAPPCAVQISDQGCEKVESAIGIFGTSPEIVVTKIFTVLLSISGGIAILIFMTSGYRMITSQGSPDGIKASQEMIVSAIVGLLFIVFSYMLLGFIGKDLLKLPGF